MKDYTGSRVFHRITIMLLCLTLSSVLHSQVVNTVNENLSADSCSSFRIMHDGTAVYATNYNNRVHEGLVIVNKRGLLKRGWQEGATGKVAEWRVKYGSVTFNLVGYQYAWSGMNEAGLVMSTMNLPGAKNPEPDERPHLDTGIWVQYILDTCASIDEVFEHEAEIRISGAPEHYMICDRSGVSMTLEFINGRMICHRGDDLPVTALTNNTYETSLNFWRENRDRNLGNQSFGSLKRFCKVADRLSSYSAGSRDEAIDFAFETLHQVRGEQYGTSITQWSIVFDTGRQEVYFRTHTHRGIRKLKFSDFNFSCSTPAKILDIHEKLSGDVSSFFADYSHEVNLKHMMRFLVKWGIPQKESDIAELLRLFESYTCDDPVVK